MAKYWTPAHSCSASKENPYRWKINPDQFSKAAIEEFKRREKIEERRENNILYRLWYNFIHRLR